MFKYKLVGGHIELYGQNILIGGVHAINIVLSCLVNILPNTPKESNGQGWVAWCNLVEICIKKKHVSMFATPV